MGNPNPQVSEDEVRQEARRLQILRGIKVLFVEDDPDTRTMVTFILENHGAHVTALESASEALQAGTNVLAIHCHQTGGGQYIDAGFVLLTYPDSE